MDRAGDILKGLLGEKNLDASLLAHGLFSGWEQIVGRPLCEHTRVVDIDGKRLVVQVDHPGWYQRLQFRREEILRSLHVRYPKLQIDGMKMHLKSAGGRRVVDPSPGGERDANTTDPETGNIADEKLRKSLQRLYEGLLMRERPVDSED